MELFNSFECKNTKNFLGFIAFAGVGCTIYFLWGIWSLYVDFLIYDKNGFNENFITLVVLGFIQAMLLQIMAVLILFCSLCCFEPIYKVVIMKKEPFNSCHGVLMILLMIPLFCLYLGYYSMEAHFQKVDIPDVFSEKSLTYLLAGFLKPLPTLSLLISVLIYDMIEQKKGHTVHTTDSKLSKV